MDESTNPVHRQTEQEPFGDLSRAARELFKSEELERQKKAAHREMVFRRDTTEWLIAISLGIDLSQAVLHRYIATEIYVETTGKQGEENYKTAKAFSDLLEAAGFESLDESSPEWGSLRWRRAHRTKSRKSARQLDDRLTLVQLALTQAFKKVGAQVEDQTEDRAAMERVEATHYAELKKTEAETRKADAEAMKAKAEALEALSKASNNFVMQIKR